MAADDYFPPDSNTSAKGAWVEAEQVSIEAAALEAFDRLVTSLYGCVENRQGFEPFLQCIREELNLASCSLAVIQKEPQLKGLYGWALGYPPGVVPLMLKTGLVFKDKAISRALELGPNAVFSYASGDPQADVFADMSPFSRTWVRAAGIIDSAAIAFTNKFSHHIVLVLNRHKSNRVFNAAEMALLARMKKHMEIALDLYERLHRSEQVFRDLKSSIALLKQPVAVFSPVCRLISASPTFVEMGARYGVFDVNGEDGSVEFRDADFGQAFHTQLMLFITGKTAALDDTDTLYLATDALPLRFSITPVHSAEHDNNTILVEIFDPNTLRMPTVSDIRKVINATEAEARVCLALVNGADAARAADELGLAVSTVRTNIKALLQKNNFSRQVDLITHVLRICS